uniref:Uncharacterized protein n=1 Tax=Arundo donax TaxID=35708 RepID=A0A0A9EGK5_ARUDO
MSQKLPPPSWLPTAPMNPGNLAPCAILQQLKSWLPQLPCSLTQLPRRRLVTFRDRSSKRQEPHQQPKPKQSPRTKPHLPPNRPRQPPHQSSAGRKRQPFFGSRNTPRRSGARSEVRMRRWPRLRRHPLAAGRSRPGGRRRR